MNSLSMHDGDSQARMGVDVIEVRGPVAIDPTEEEPIYCTLAIKDATRHAYLDLDRHSTLALLYSLCGALDCVAVPWRELHSGGSSQ